MRSGSSRLVYQSGASLRMSTVAYGAARIASDNSLGRRPRVLEVHHDPGVRRNPGAEAHGVPAPAEADGEFQQVVPDTGRESPRFLVRIPVRGQPRRRRRHRSASERCTSQAGTTTS